MAAAAEEASSQSSAVAAATEQLSKSIEEIAGQVARSTTISQEAVGEAQQSNEQVDGAEVAEDADLAANETDVEVDAEADAETLAEVEAEEFDEAGLDEQGFTDEDDEFRPSEVIPTDQSIDFPTDI